MLVTAIPALGRERARARWRSCDRAATRREIVTAAALGVSVLALAVPAVWVSRARMEAVSVLRPVLREGASVRVRDGAADPDAEEPEAPPAVAAEVRRLRLELIRKDVECQRLRDELEGALSFRRKAAEGEVELGRFVEAFVIGQAVNWQERSFIVDRGAADGVVVRAGVLVGGAAAGVVVEVGSHAARVAMLTEPGVMVAARTLDTGRTGLAVGTGVACDLRYVERWSGRQERPHAGEYVVTTGRLGFFPPGYLLGMVSSVGETPDSLELNVAVRPEVTEPPRGRVWILKTSARRLDE